MKIDEAIIVITETFKLVYNINPDSIKRFKKELKYFLTNFVNEEER